MLTERENFLETLRKNGKPDRLVNGFTPFRVIGGDPVFRYLRGNRIRGTDSYDRFGTLISFPEDQPAATPIVTEDNQVIKDIECWREFVKIPDLYASCAEGWEECRKQVEAVDQSRFLTMSIMGTGIFEQLHMLMTFENTLCNFLLYPDEMHELIEAITEYRLTYMRLLAENLHPDVIVSHDDFGSARSLFMSPEIWREFFKAPYTRLYGYLHDRGIIVMHHSDSFVQPIASDIADTGADILQGVIPTNDISVMTRELDGCMALMGGINSIIDREDTPEGEITREVCRVFDEYGELKCFVPSITYGGPGSIFERTEKLVTREIDRCNLMRFGVSDGFA